MLHLEGCARELTWGTGGGTTTWSDPSSYLFWMGHFQNGIGGGFDHNHRLLPQTRDRFHVLVGQIQKRGSKGQGYTPASLTWLGHIHHAMKPIDIKKKKQRGANAQDWTRKGYFSLISSSHVWLTCSRAVSINSSSLFSVSLRVWTSRSSLASKSGPLRIQSPSVQPKGDVLYGVSHQGWHCGTYVDCQVCLDVLTRTPAPRRMFAMSRTFLMWTPRDCHALFMSSMPSVELSTIPHKALVLWERTVSHFAWRVEDIKKMVNKLNVTHTYFWPVSNVSCIWLNMLGRWWTVSYPQVASLDETLKQTM